MGMASVALTGIISRTGSWCCPKRKELPDSATSNGYHFVFFTDFLCPVREIHAKSGNRNRKNGIKRRLPGGILKYLAKGIYSLSFTKGIFKGGVCNLALKSVSTKCTKYIKAAVLVKFLRKAVNKHTVLY